MSFHNNLFMPRDAGCLSDGKMDHGTLSKVEQKRHRLWDAPEQEPFGSKKQAAESIDNRPIPAIANVNIFSWDNASRCQSAPNQFNGQLFAPESLRTFSISDPLCLTGGLRKTDVNQVTLSMNAFSMAMGHHYTIGQNNNIAISSTYQRSNNGVAFQPTYGKDDGNAISLCPTFTKGDDNLITMGQTLSKGGHEFMLMGHHYNRPNDHINSLGHQYNKGSCSFISLDQPYVTGNSNFLSNDPAYNKGHENFVMMVPPFGKTTEYFKSMDRTFDKRDAVITLLGPSHPKEDASTMPMGITYDKANPGILSVGQSFEDGEGTIISFGPEANNSTGGTISSSHMLTNEPSMQAIEVPTEKDSIEANVNQLISVPSTNKTDEVPKNKVQKKVQANSFPSNVKSLLSTGILDGVPVKYVSWSREKTLRGVIRGSGYLCDCNDCKFAKVVNAYEFERHAGCKTKHPNNHIYFENGKTIYTVVQELKSTPQEKLFEAIQTVTGSPINQKNFRLWKVSFQAAARELARIYGKEKDEVVVPTSFGLSS